MGLGAATAGVSAGLGLVSGGMKFFESRKMQRKAEEAIGRFQWQELENPFKNLQVSTLGSDLRREEAARTTSTLTNAIQNSGARGIIGGLGNVQNQNNLVNREIAANLDEQQKQIDYSAAQQDVRNQDTIERRQAEELQGYGQQLDYARDMKYDGISNAVNAIGAIGQIGKGGGKGSKKGSKLFSGDGDSSSTAEKPAYLK